MASEENSRQPVKVGVVGATGYTGVELLRLLAPRDDIEVSVVTSRDLAGLPVSKHFPNLRGHLDLAFSNPDIDELTACDVVFFATPHAVAMNLVPALYAAGVRIIDISADFRIQNIALWEQWYGCEHVCPELVAQAVYGLPEINREQIRGAQLIAVPGCYPTAIQLGFLPLLEQGLVDTNSLIADAKSGVSGAGRKAAVDYLLTEASESIKAYALNGHRHHPEICQGLDNFAGEKVKLTFVPHLTPMIRGILATLYARVKPGVEVSQESLEELFAARYADEPFVDVMSSPELPATRNVRGANICQIAVKYIEENNQVVVVAAEDNLVKGASGQAIQALNIMLGIEETSGLRNIALLP